MIYIFCIVSNQFIARIHAFKYTPFSNRDRYISMLNWQKFMRTLIPFHSIQFWTICKIKLDGVWIAHGNQFSIKILPHIQPQTNSFSAVHLRIGERRKKSAQSQIFYYFDHFSFEFCITFYAFSITLFFYLFLKLDWNGKEENQTSYKEKEFLFLSFIKYI